MKRALIEEVTEHEASSNAVVPKLVVFASGDKAPPDARFKSFRNRTTGDQVLTSETPRLGYVNRQPPQMLMLAVVNRATGKARLVPMESYRLSPALESTETSTDTTDAATPAARPTRDDLGRTMGLATWKKLRLKSERLSVGSGAASVAQSISQAVQDLPEEAPPVVTPSEDEFGLVPPQNVDATEPEEVFCRQDVVPAPLWTRLAVAEPQFKTSLEKHSSEHPYVVKYLEIFEEDADEEKATLLTYAFYMLRLLKYLQGMKLKKSWKQLDIPAPVLEHMRETFMERSHDGWDRSQRLQDKLVCYFLVVALWIHDYTLDLNEISAATRTPVKHLRLYCTALGLTSSVDKAVLKLPLKVRVQPDSQRRAKKVSRL